MIIRSKAPLRLGLAGGGSDVSPDFLNNWYSYKDNKDLPNPEIVYDAIINFDINKASDFANNIQNEFSDILKTLICDCL